MVVSFYTMSKDILSRKQISALSSLYMGPETVLAVLRFFKSKHAITLEMKKTVKNKVAEIRENLIIIEDLYDSGLLLDHKMKNSIQKSIVKCHFERNEIT